MEFWVEEASYGNMTRKNIVNKSDLVKFVMQISVSGFSLIRVVKSSLLAMGEGETFTNRNFLYKCKLPLHKENLGPIFKDFSGLLVLNGLSSK